MYKRSFHNLTFIRIWPGKPFFFEGWSWFKFNNLRLALVTNLKFYSSLSKGLKLKVKMFWWLILMFVEVTGENLVAEGGGRICPPSWIGLNQFKFILKDNNYKLFDSYSSARIKQRFVKYCSLEICFGEEQENIQISLFTVRSFQFMKSSILVQIINVNYRIMNWLINQKQNFETSSKHSNLRPIF